MGQSLRIFGPDGSFTAYLSRPAVPRAPAVVVLQEIFGVNADLRATCDELAAQGFLALAPELFWRDAPGLDLSDASDSDWKRGIALYTAYDFDRGVCDVAAAIAAARDLAGANGKAGVMGFCLGGLMAFLAATRIDVDAAVAYYGGQTEKYVDETTALRAPLLMHLAGEDEYMTPDAQAWIRASLAGRPHVQIHGYPGCAHAFARHGGAHYEAAAAALANARTFAFLHTQLD